PRAVGIPILHDAGTNPAVEFLAVLRPLLDRVEGEREEAGLGHLGGLSRLDGRGPEQERQYVVLIGGQCGRALNLFHVLLVPFEASEDDAGMLRAIRRLDFATDPLGFEGTADGSGHRRAAEARRL